MGKVVFLGSGRPSEEENGGGTRKMRFVAQAGVRSGYTQMNHKIILSSNSPRRRELMEGLGIPFTVDTGNLFEEHFRADTPHEKVPMLMSEGKSMGFHRPLEPDEVLITADTMVLLHNRGNRLQTPESMQDRVNRSPIPGNLQDRVDCSPIFGKPRDRDEAVEMLHELSGRTHEVITSVTIRSLSRKDTFQDSTLVTFRALTDEEINWYIDKYQPYDKAGSYGVQEWIGYIAITGIQGSFYNVMGLPTHKLYSHLKAFL